MKAPHAVGPSVPCLVRADENAMAWVVVGGAKVLENKGFCRFGRMGVKFLGTAIPPGAVWCIRRGRASEQGPGGGRGKPQCAHPNWPNPHIKATGGGLARKMLGRQARLARAGFGHFVPQRLMWVVGRLQYKQ